MKRCFLIHLLAIVVISFIVVVGCSKDDNSNPASANNHPPVIRSVTANPNPADHDISGNFFITTLSCVATDPDGDSLSYHWTCAFGGFYDRIVIGQTVECHCRTVGDYWVSVTVNDGKEIDVDSVKVFVI